MRGDKSPLGRFLALPGTVLAAGVLTMACSSPSTTPNPTTGTGVITGSPSQLLNAGVAALKAGNTTAAAASFQQVLSSDPSNKSGDNKIADFDLGVISESQGDHSTAEAYYQAAIKLDPKYTGALYNLAIEETSAKPGDAIALYKRAIASSPSDVNALYNLGLLLIQTGQIDQGKGYLNQALKIDPSIANTKLPTGPTS